MQKLTIGRMAKLYGLHRSTLYEAVEKGRVSTGFDGKGQKVIDLSEMIRVYGEPPGNPRQSPTEQPDTNQTPTSGDLMSRFDELIAVVKEQRDELKSLREEVAQLRRLPAPERADPQPEPKAIDSPSEKVTSMADIEARLRARLGK